MNNVIQLSPKSKNQAVRPSVDIEQFLHDIRSPIGALKIFLNGSVSEDNISLIKMCAERIEDMVSKLTSSAETECNQLAFNEPSTTTPLTKTIYEVILEKSAELKTPIAFHRNSEADHSLVKFQRMEFKRLFSNLINNSFEACQNKKKIEIKIRTFCLYDRLMIELNDNGQAIDPQRFARIFDRGFSTKGSSGLGLSHAREAIERWNGDLKILSWPDHGTTVVISLPIYPTP